MYHHYLLRVVSIAGASAEVDFYTDQSPEETRDLIAEAKNAGVPFTISTEGGHTGLDLRLIFVWSLKEVEDVRPETNDIH